MAVAAFIGAMFSARLAQQIGTKLTVALGILIAAAGLFYFYKIAGVDTTYWKIAVGMGVTALGMGVTMSPATNSIMGSVPVDEAGVGSAMNDTNRQIGGALGVAILGTLLNSSYAKSIDKITWPSPLPPQAMAAIRGSVQGAQITAGTVQKQSPPFAQFIVSQANQAFTASMAHTLLVAAIIMAAAAVVVLVILPTRIRPYSETKNNNPKPAEKNKPGMGV